MRLVDFVCSFTALISMIFSLYVFFFISAVWYIISLPSKLQTTSFRGTLHDQSEWQFDWIIQNDSQEWNDEGPYTIQSDWHSEWEVFSSVYDKLSCWVQTWEVHTWVRQERIKLFGAPRQWKHFRPLFQTPRLPVPRQK